MLRTGLDSSSGVLRRALRKWGVAAVVAAGLAASVAVPTVTEARGPETRAVAGVVALAALPPQAQETHRLILNGGPFAYSKDGTVFGNRERQLPSKSRGYYREYTVKTLGAHDRGARRIICGGMPPTRPDACYYTDDHYASFRRINP